MFPISPKAFNVSKFLVTLNFQERLMFLFSKAFNVSDFSAILKFSEAFNVSNFLEAVNVF